MLALFVKALREATHEHASVLLVGDPGVGKTCLLRALRHRLPEAGFRLTYCHDATLGRRDFYRQLCLALGLNPHATAAAVFFAISSLVLVGLPELWDRLRRNRSLCSRLHCRLAIGQALPEDTAEHVAYRVAKAGSQRDLFSSDALALVHESTAGLLRDIDRLGTECLEQAARRKLKAVDRELVERVLEAEDSRRQSA